MKYDEVRPTAPPVARFSGRVVDYDIQVVRPTGL
jgi:hypothetical protein